MDFQGWVLKVSATENILAPSEVGGKISFGFNKDEIGSGEDFQPGLGVVGLDCTAELVTRVSICFIQIPVDFPNIVTKMSINLCSASLTGSC